MHLGNGALTPECAALSAAVAAAGLGFAAAHACRAPRRAGDWLAAGAWGGAIFAAQMINVPVLPFSSGHLVGGVLLAVVLGPGRGALTTAIVLALQALLLGDGGIAALGANIVNMALVPACIVATGRTWRGETAGTARLSLTSGLEAAIATLVAAALIVPQVALFRDPSSVPLAKFAATMLGTHVVIGLLEGGLTAALVAALYGRSRAQQAIFGAAATVATLALVPLASSLPDGYEASAESSGWGALLWEAPEELAALGELNAAVAAWQESAAEQMLALAGGDIPLAVLATIAAALVSLAVAWLVASRPAAAQAA